MINPEFNDMVMLVTSLYASALTFVATLILIPLIRRLALLSGMVDVPGGRKQHTEPVPPMGGIAIFTVVMAVMIGLGLMANIVFPSALYLALAITLVVGVVDDMRPLDARFKFAMHFLVAAILVVWGGAKIATLGNVLGLGELNLYWLKIPFSIACIVYIINAVNMMDGLDGLAGGNALIIMMWLGLAALLGGQMDIFLMIAVFSAALLGFLFYNARAPWRKSAKIFLGDAGSMGVGIMIAWFAITLSQRHNFALEPISVAWIIALPIVDSFGLLVARIKDKKPPFAPDRRHFHHHFINAGFSVGGAVYTIILWSAVLGAIGFFGIKAGIPAGLLGWGWIALWLTHTLITVKSGRFVALLSKLRGARPEGQETSR